MATPELAAFLTPPAASSKQLAAFLEAPLEVETAVRSEIAAFLIEAEQLKPSVATAEPVPLRRSPALEPTDLIKLFRQKAIAGQRPTTLKTAAAVQRSSPVYAVHADQVRQITNDLRAGHCSTTFPVLPAELRLSNLL